MSAFLKARRPGKSSQTHTHRNKQRWGITEGKPGGDEACPQGLILHRAVYDGLVFEQGSIRSKAGHVCTFVTWNASLLNRTQRVFSSTQFAAIIGQSPLVLRYYFNTYYMIELDWIPPPYTHCAKPVVNTTRVQTCHQTTFIEDHLAPPLDL